MFAQLSTNLGDRVRTEKIVEHPFAFEIAPDLKLVLEQLLA